MAASTNAFGVPGRLSLPYNKAVVQSLEKGK